MTAPPEPRNVLLERLRASPDDWVSGQDLCAALNCSRTAIWKQIEALRRHGYTVDARPRMGYRLTGVPEAPLPDEVAPRLTTDTLGRQLAWLPSVDSTNRWLAEKADAGAPDGFVVTADTQTAGRGRLDRGWYSPPAINLYASLLLRPDVPLDRAASLALLLGLAVRRALCQLAPGLDIRIKWPNDIWIGSRKVCGILCDMRAEPDRIHHVVAGIGLNVNTTTQDFPRDIRPHATSLRMAAGRFFPRAEVLAAILNALEPVYRDWIAHGLEPFLAELNEADLLKGRAVTLAQGARLLTGLAAGIAPDGALLLTGPDGIASIYSGDVSIRSISGLRE
jgi:BirA family biotin operon repressor/biotin-[acetyl-CoA-carboxylase] ligase